MGRLTSHEDSGMLIAGLGAPDLERAAGRTSGCFVNLRRFSPGAAALDGPVLLAAVVPASLGEVQGSSSACSSSPSSADSSSSSSLASAAGGGCAARSRQHKGGGVSGHI